MLFVLYNGESVTYRDFLVTADLPRKDGRFSMLKSDPTVRPYSRYRAAPCILLTVHVTVCAVPCGWLVLQAYFIDCTYRL